MAMALLAASVMLFVTEVQAQSTPDVRWEMVAGTGETPAAFYAEHPCVTSIYHWNANADAYVHWFPNVPDYVNSVNSIDNLDTSLGYFIAYDRQCLAGG